MYTAHRTAHAAGIVRHLVSGDHYVAYDSLYYPGSRSDVQGRAEWAQWSFGLRGRDVTKAEQKELIAVGAVRPRQSTLGKCQNLLQHQGAAPGAVAMQQFGGLQTPRPASLVQPLMQPYSCMPASYSCMPAYPVHGMGYSPPVGTGLPSSSSMVPPLMPSSAPAATWYDADSLRDSGSSYAGGWCGGADGGSQAHSRTV